MGPTAENGIAVAQGEKERMATDSDGRGADKVPLGPADSPADPTNANRPHNPLDPEAFYSSEHNKERQERQLRRRQLKEFRKPIAQLPLNHGWEIPGR